VRAGSPTRGNFKNALIFTEKKRRDGGIPALHQLSINHTITGIAPIDTAAHAGISIFVRLTMRTVKKPFLLTPPPLYVKLAVNLSDSISEIVGSDTP
jgi:hypothetical protein